MKKVFILTVLLASVLVSGFSQTDPNYNYRVTGHFANWDSNYEQRFMMTSIAITDERIKDIRGALTDAMYIYLWEYNAASVNPAGWTVNYSGAGINLDGRFAVKIIRLMKNGDFDMWMPSAEAGGMRNLSPDTLYVPMNRSDAARDAARDGLGSNNDNPVLLNGAQTYYIVFAVFRDGSRGLGAVATAPTQSSSRQVFVKSQSGDTIVQLDSFAETIEWLHIFAQSNTSYIIEVNADESISSQNLTFSGKSGITITLRGVGANRTISFQNDSYYGSSGYFSVDSGVTLVLDNNITLREGGVRVNSGATLVMNDGSNITSSRNSAVSVNGTFTMNGGTISGNTGSGVWVYEGSTFTMNGGTISSNIGSGVLVDGGTFIMSSGTISDNISGNGGGVSVSGVYMGSNGTFTMNGGTITGNTSQGDNISGGEGGGVYVHDRGVFTMSNGTISDNISRNGGGVYMNGGTFTMNNGIISGNIASSGRNANGGGVNVSGGTFTMNGGTISDNTASSNGGGVFVGRTFTMSGGTISGNTANERGGGVYVIGTFNMSNGTISGNTASQNGGGVYVYSDYSGGFTKTGGTIYGYSASDTNSNVVKNESGAVQNFRGHAVWAGSTETLLKIRQGTARPGDNMSYDGSTTPPTASGAWDN